MKKWVTTAVLSTFLFTSATVYAALPTTPAAGDANRTALIYTGYAAFAEGVAPRNWKSPDFQPYLTYMAKDPTTGKLQSVNTNMFDTFLFLSPWASSRTDAKGLIDLSGMNTDHTQGTKADWQQWINGNFQAGFQLDALAQAVRDYARPLTPGYKAKVIMMLPYPDKSVTEWDKGISFQDNTNRLNAVKWFVQEFLSKYDATKTSFDGKPLADYLELTGFYWMKENFSDNWQQTGENKLILAVNSYIDSLPPQNGKDLNSYVIPYMSAEAYSARVKPWGFDFGWLQPSHYFHGSATDLSYLNRASNWAEKYGLGVELEADWQIATNDMYLKLFRDYLNYGSENGWMAAPLALYGDIDSSGKTTLDYLAGNTDKPNDKLRSTYDDLYLFLNDAYNPNKLAKNSPVSTRVRNTMHNTHLIQLEKGDKLTFTLDSRTGNADLYLLDENFKSVARSFRLNGYRDEISYEVPKTGTYYVRIFGNGDSQYTASIQTGISKSGYSPSTALDTRVGADIRNRLNPLEDRVYKVSLQQGQTYTISAKPGSTVQNVDLYVYPDAVSDTGAASSYKGPAGVDRVTFTVEKSGDYYVMLRGGQIASDYTLQIQTGEQPAPEDGYEAKTAFSVAVDSKLSNPILKDQTLWYKMAVEQGKIYTILMNPQTGLDVDIDLYSSVAATSAERGDLARSDRGPGIPDAILYTAKQSGEIYVKAKAFGEGNFEINALSGNQLPAGYTPDNPIALKGTHSYQVNKGDVVYYSLPVEAGKDYVVSLTPNAANMNANLEVFASTLTSFENRVGASLAGDGATERVVLHATQSGQYILKVSGVNETRYNLRVETPGSDGSSPEKGKPLSIGQPVNGTMGQGKSDYLKIWLEKGQRYRIQATGKEAGQDVDLDVYQSMILGDETLIGSSHGPQGYQDQVTFTPLTTGYYYVKVQGYTNVEYQVEASKQ